LALKIAREGRLLRVTMARPEKRNALSEEMCKGLVEAFKEPAGAILLDAEGPVFCSGMDLDAASPETTSLHAELFSAGFASRVPIVAAIQGPALGGGAGLVANAHVAVAAHGTQFGLTELRVGMWPFVIWPAISRAIGSRQALYLTLTGRLFGVQEALQWGLIHEAVAPVEVEDRALAIATALAESSPVAIRAGMEMALADVRAEADRGLRLREPVMRGADFAEGLAALREKRRPNWPSLAE
jgi:enoyl-CoA hydratase/carnithine racemase